MLMSHPQKPAGPLLHTIQGTGVQRKRGTHTIKLLPAPWGSESVMDCSNHIKNCPQSQFTVCYYMLNEPGVQGLKTGMILVSVPTLGIEHELENQDI